MAAVLLYRIKWYALANWPKRAYFFTRMLGQCTHSNGNIYLVTFTTESEDFDPESWVITP